MERYYQSIVILLFVGILFIFGVGMPDEGLNRLGWVLVLASAFALLVGVVRRRWGAGQ